MNLNDKMKRLAAARRSKVERRADRLIAEETARTARAADLGAEDCIPAPPVERLPPHDGDGEALLAAYEHGELKPVENQGVAKRAAIRAAKRHRAKGRKRTSTTV